jgi:hypothetical protein
MPQQGTQAARGNPIQDYVTVAERIDKFYERFSEGRIITHIIEHDAERGFVLVRAEVYRNPDDALPAASGHAYEYKSDGYVQKTSYIEVCETSAVGRALAMAGFEVKRGVAIREEMEKTRRTEPERPQQATGASSAPPATEAQKKEILTLWNSLTTAGEFADSNAWQKDLRERTGASSRDDLRQATANAYIASLQRLLKEANAEADKRAAQE